MKVPALVRMSWGKDHNKTFFVVILRATNVKNQQFCFTSICNGKWMTQMTFNIRFLDMNATLISSKANDFDFQFVSLAS